MGTVKEINKDLVFEFMKKHRHTICFEEAKAELESAEYKRQADSIRAEGVAEANRIIAKSITPEYIKWKWVEGLHDGSSEVIYVATEANVQIMEANRLSHD